MSRNEFATATLRLRETTVRARGSHGTCPECGRTVTLYPGAHRLAWMMRPHADCAAVGLALPVRPVPVLWAEFTARLSRCETLRNDGVRDHARAARRAFALALNKCDAGAYDAALGHLANAEEAACGIEGSADATARRPADDDELGAGTIR